ncbi:hypothetical protein [Motiliproteus sp. SC1-56]|uniref:hypothetical protein n=1 Tax=Motiliproteus sp. SC1-56 TaxID=2799565 RepID=UPI001A8CBE40|nr:hypothetical protein [Motiliproteus sp. SC1-56]
MNTTHFETSTAYLDGVLLTLAGDKVVTLTYGDEQNRFYINEAGEVNRCGEDGPLAGGERDFELYRMAFLEALISGGSLIVRQLEAGELALPEALGGGKVPLDYLSGAEIGPKGLRGLRADELKSAYPNGAEGATDFRDFLSKEQVRVALIKQVEQQASQAQTVGA